MLINALPFIVHTVYELLGITNEEPDTVRLVTLDDCCNLLWGKTGKHNQYINFYSFNTLTYFIVQILHNGSPKLCNLP